MKKILTTTCLTILLALTSCQSQNENNLSDVNSDEKTTKEVDTIKLGVSPTPHGEIAKVAKEVLKDEGIDLEIVEFDDYIAPNNALNEGDIDANYFQHTPYLENFNEDNNMDLIAVSNVHLEPIGLYSKKYDSIEKIEDESEVIIPNDPTNGARALKLLEDNGLIKLKKDAGIEATEKDIEENPKNLKFTAMEAPSIPRTYEDSDLAVINSNYALQDGLSPLDDTIALESKDSPYTNVIAVRPEDKDSEKTKKLVEAFSNEKVKEFIDKHYKGAVISALKN